MVLVLSIHYYISSDDIIHHPHCNVLFHSLRDNPLASVLESLLNVIDSFRGSLESRFRSVESVQVDS